MNTITAYAHIKQNTISVNGSVVFKTEPQLSLSEFLSEAYKSLNISYPKFHKMDLQCKLGVLCTDFAVKNSDVLTQNTLTKIAVVLSNNSSSLETDRNYQASINDQSNYFPSPTIFVYTLPNIVIGEIAIKHKITGENAFFVCDKLNPALLVNYTDAILVNNDACICGWVEVDGDNYEAFIFLVQKQNDTNKSSIFKPLNQLSVITLYNQTIWTH